MVMRTIYWGLEELAAAFPKAEIIASQQTVDKMSLEAPQSIRKNGGGLRPFPDNAGAATKVIIPKAPKAYTKDTYELDGEKIQLIAVGQGETDYITTLDIPSKGTSFRPYGAKYKRDTTWMPSNGTYWGADVVISGIHFLMDEVESQAARNRWTKNCQDVKKLVMANNRSVVPGHLDNRHKWTTEQMLDYPIKYIATYEEALKMNASDKFWDRVMTDNANDGLLFLLDWSSTRFYTSERTKEQPHDIMAENKLSLQNALLTLEQLQQTPSRADGISEEQEDNLRQLGCHLIQTAGMLMKLPQVAMATAQILFQRFFYQASLQKFAVRDISMGSIFLAAKVEECPCRLSDLINVIDHLCKKFRRKALDPLPQFGQEFYDLKNATVIAEMQILKKLAFNVHVQLPYAIMVNYLRVLDLTDHSTIPQRAWSFLNDGLRTSVYICYQPPTIAASVIWLAAREAGVRLPTNPAWWEVLDSNLEDIENIAGHIKSLYYKTLPIPDLPLRIEEVEPYLARQRKAASTPMDVDSPSSSKPARPSRFS
ncbi:cyclin L [Entomortierella parvispora]|uniref:Cyclin L n=1 Tax=Entomortierella parvispora TaxID=205924 RepID=A0A9P3HHD6_9FUNG|nr:cyclin L [Entomortierella parvispora]